MNSRQPATDPRLTAGLVGCSTVIAQALLLRESMAAMGGSEMAWGVVIALWLVGMAVGSSIGVRYGSARTAGWLPIVVVLLAGVGTVVLRAAPFVIGSAPGETITTASAIWLWIVATTPAAIAGGLAFPVLASSFGAGGGGRAYAFEAVGSLAGGIFLSMALLHLGTAGALCVSIGTLAAGLAWQRRSIALSILAVTTLAMAIPADGVLARVGWTWSDHPGTLKAWMETRYQQIAISDGPPVSIYGDGRLLASYPDPYAVLPRAHLLMLLHPRPRNVLAIGCLVDGSVEALSLHAIDRLTVVEEDPELLAALPEIFGTEMEAALNRPKVHAIAADPLRAFEGTEDWDLVLLLDGSPTTLRHNRTRTLEFLRQCRTRMRPDGVLVMRAGVSDTYVGGTGGRLLSVLASTLRNVFEQLVFIPGEEVFLVAGGPQAEITLDHEILLQRLDQTGLDTSQFLPEILPILVDNDRSLDLTARISLDSEPNTIDDPRAVLLAAGLHEARALPGLLPAISTFERVGLNLMSFTLAAAILFLFMSVRWTRHGNGAIAATLGFCSMGWWLLLIASWQSTNGSVYSEIGGLTALFMAGVAVGAWLASRRQRPQQIVPAVLATGCALSVALAAGLAITAPTVLIPFFLAVGGLVTGAAFPGLTQIGSKDRRRRAGVVFAADEAGAAAAAIAIGIFVIPWAGLTATAWGLAALQLAAIPSMFITLRRS